MKKFTIYLTLLIFACHTKTAIIANHINDKSASSNVVTADTASLAELTKVILTSIKNKDYKKFVSYIHPLLGVRFSPYSYIEKTDMVIKAKDFVNKVNSNKKMKWGEYDGIGGAILLTTKRYFKLFVYDIDFLNQTMSVNKAIGYGNTANNLKEFYPNCDFVEMYYPGSGNNMDWSGLRLVFKKYKGQYYLIGLVHDQWTV